MDVSKERLSIIGKMIGIYREEKRGNTQNSFTQKRFCKDICSTNTLKNIEKGELARSIDVYDELLAKFDLKLGEFPNIDNAILKLTDDLYKAIEYYNNDAISNLTNKALRLLKEVSNYVYYSELFDLFNDLNKYYLKYEFISYEKVKRYTNLLNIVPEQLYDFYRLLIFAKMRYECTFSFKVFDKLVEDIGLKKCFHAFLKINLLQYYYSMKKFKVMNALITELENYFIRSKNDIRLLDVLNYSIVLNSYIDFDDCEEYIDKAKEFIETHTLPDIKVGEIYSNIAVAYHANNDYSSALEFFNKMLSFPFVNALDKFIIMADCQNHSSQAIKIPIIEDNDFLKFPEDIRIMYKYFTIDESIPAFAKENYILRMVLPILKNEVYVKIFRYELVRLVSITNHYKRLHTFDDSIKSTVEFS